MKILTMPAYRLAIFAVADAGDLRSTVDTLTRRTITTDAREVLDKAGAKSGRVVELFLADMGDKVKIDPKTGNTTGLDAIAEWKKQNADFFKVEDDGSSGARTKDNKQGLPDLSTLKTASERKAAIAQFKRGVGARSGYGNASSKR